MSVNNLSELQSSQQLSPQELKQDSLSNSTSSYTSNTLQSSQQQSSQEMKQDSLNNSTSSNTSQQQSPQEVKQDSLSNSTSSYTSNILQPSQQQSPQEMKQDSLNNSTSQNISNILQSSQQQSPQEVRQDSFYNSTSSDTSNILLSNQQLSPQEEKQDSLNNSTSQNTSNILQSSQQLSPQEVKQDSLYNSTSSNSSNILQSSQLSPEEVKQDSLNDSTSSYTSNIYQPLGESYIFSQTQMQIQEKPLLKSLSQKIDYWQSLLDQLHLHPTAIKQMTTYLFECPLFKETEENLKQDFINNIHEILIGLSQKINQLKLPNFRSEFLQIFPKETDQEPTIKFFKYGSWQYQSYLKNDNLLRIHISQLDYSRLEKLNDLTAEYGSQILLVLLGSINDLSKEDNKLKPLFLQGIVSLKFFPPSAWSCSQVVLENTTATETISYINLNLLPSTQQIPGQKFHLTTQLKEIRTPVCNDFLTELINDINSREATKLINSFFQILYNFDQIKQVAGIPMSYLCCAQYSEDKTIIQSEPQDKKIFKIELPKLILKPQERIILSSTSPKLPTRFWIEVYNSNKIDIIQSNVNDDAQDINDNIYLKILTTSKIDFHGFKHFQQKLIFLNQSQERSVPLPTYLTLMIRISTN